MSFPAANQPMPEDDAIDLSEFVARVRRGLPLSLGLACIGLAVVAIAFVIAAPFQDITTATRVVFAFPGFERGEYPDKSKFSPDDLRSPEIVAEALKRRGMPSIDSVQAQVRAALNIEGIIPDSVIRERDRQRAAGQTPRVYIPDEYSVTLTLPRNFPLSGELRSQLLSEIVSIYGGKFSRTYIELPLELGKAFESLRDADYFDYELVLKRENSNISEFLEGMFTAARAFRSPRTNLSFADLLKQSQLFNQIRLNEVLGLIHKNGLSKDRHLALVKMDYYLRSLADDELRAVQNEKVIQDLLKQAQEREQRYALGIKSQANQQKNDGVVVDQGLVDSLLANDAYNFLVRQALEASLKTRRIQADRAILQDRRNSMESFIKSDAAEKAEALSQFHVSLTELRKVYDTLVNDIRLTYEDYQKQQYADAVRISMRPKAQSYYRSLAKAGIAGFGISGALGLGLSLLGIGIGRAKSAGAS